MWSHTKTPKRPPRRSLSGETRRADVKPHLVTSHVRHARVPDRSRGSLARTAEHLGSRCADVPDARLPPRAQAGVTGLRVAAKATGAADRGSSPRGRETVSPAGRLPGVPACLLLAAAAGRQAASPTRAARGPGSARGGDTGARATRAGDGGEICIRAQGSTRARADARAQPSGFIRDTGGRLSAARRPTGGLGLGPLRGAGVIFAALFTTRGVAAPASVATTATARASSEKHSRAPVRRPAAGRLRAASGPGLRPGSVRGISRPGLQAGPGPTQGRRGRGGGGV